MPPQMKILNTVIPLINNKQNTTPERTAAVSTTSRPIKISLAETSFLIQLLLNRKNSLVNMEASNM